jgi:hypothetical protein
MKTPPFHRFHEVVMKSCFAPQCLVAFLVAVLMPACTATPLSPSVWSGTEIRAQLVATNLNHPTTGARGHLTRWRVPIEVNINGIARAAEAIRRVEQWSGGTIRFTSVPGVPAQGIVFVEGGATAQDSTAACVNLTDAPPEAPSGTLMLRWDASSAIVGAYTIRLGSDRCNDTREGDYESAYAEHILGHALGVFDHFVGFTGVEGLTDAHAFAVLVNLYANPIGATAGELQTWPR